MGDTFNFNKDKNKEIELKEKKVNEELEQKKTSKQKLDRYNTIITEKKKISLDNIKKYINKILFNIIKK